MKILNIFLISIICVTLLTGCWDQNLLKDAKLVLTAGFDLSSDKKILTTITIPIFTAGDGGTQVTESQVVSAKGDTPRDARKILSRKISEEFDASKLMVILFGEEYAKQDIYPALDLFYRDPKSSLLSNSVVVKGRAADLLNLKLEEEKIMSEYLSGMIQSAQTNTVIPQRPKPIISDMFDPGTDFVLPLIEIEENEAKIMGLAMFNEHKYTGHDLTLQESTLYLLMADQKGKKASLKLKVHENKEPEIKNFILVNVLKSKRDLKVRAKSPDGIFVDLQLDFKVEIMEYSEDRLNSEKKINDLNKKLSEMLTSEANKTIKKMQEANSDSLGIGKHIIAHYHETWQKINWEKEYPNVNFKAKANVEISKHGIFN